MGKKRGVYQRRQPKPMDEKNQSLSVGVNAAYTKPKPKNKPGSNPGV